MAMLINLVMIDDDGKNGDNDSGDNDNDVDSFRSVANKGSWLSVSREFPNKFLLDTLTFHLTLQTHSALIP